ncbi:hypothetical protein ACFQML_05285 [Salinirubellus salinus]
MDAETEHESGRARQTAEYADLHPDVRAVMRATEALPVHDDGEVPVIELPTETGSVRASIPAHASDREAAVIAVAITAHLRDEAVAAADGPSLAGRWQLCHRAGDAVGRSLRRAPSVGDAWKVAGRVRARR